MNTKRRTGCSQNKAPNPFTKKRPHKLTFGNPIWFSQKNDATSKMSFLRFSLTPLWRYGFSKTWRFFSISHSSQHVLKSASSLLDTQFAARLSPWILVHCRVPPLQSRAATWLQCIDFSGQSKTALESPYFRTNIFSVFLFSNLRFKKNGIALEEWRF